MKIFLLVSIAIFFVISLNGQKKVNLYLQLSSEIDVLDDLNFMYATSPRPSSKKVKVESIDSLIDYDTINAIIKKMDYKGVRILSELRSCLS